MSGPDVIDTLSGLAPGSPLALIRDRKPITRDQAQASFRALFEPADAGDFPLTERFAIAVFVAGLHADDAATAFYRAELARTASDAFIAALSAAIAEGRTTGPYGAYPKGPLSVENVAGPIYAAPAGLGARMAAALAHVHMLVFHPRDANAASLRALLDGGWSTSAIVTLSQLVAFLAFQIRAAAGLRVLAGATP